MVVLRSMGDGAVVCMPSQQQQNLTERFAASEASWSGRLFGLVPEKMMKELDKNEKAEEVEEISGKEALENSEFAEGVVKPERNGELENGEVELEMGEFVPEEWGNLEEVKLEQKPERSRFFEVDRDRRNNRRDSPEDLYKRKEGHERWRRGDRRGRTSEDYYRRKEDRRRIEEKTETISHKHESTNEKHSGRDSSTTILKNRHGDSEGTSASKIRRISGDDLHSSSSTSSRSSPPARYSSSRRHGSPSSSRAHDWHTKSHYDRSHHHSHRDRASSYRDRSPHDRIRHNDCRERTTSNSSDRSPQKSVRRRDNSEKHNGRPEEKPRRREADTKDPSRQRSNQPEKERTAPKNISESREMPPPPPPPPISSPPLSSPVPAPANGVLELHHVSMEEDMDICDTPPHSSNRVEDNRGKWYYLDDYGLEQGPSRLSDLKRLVEEGALPSDHLIKHFDSDRWVTVENAASPVVSVNLGSIVSDAVTRMASPPEAPGNSQIDGAELTMEKSMLTFQSKDDCSYTVPPEGFRIDERVEALLSGHEIISGKEIETIGGQYFVLLLAVF